MVKTLIALILIAAASSAHAEQALEWKLKPEASTIRWEATQNNASIKGGFEKFNAKIRFHPNALESSKAIITINTNSITTSYDEAQSTLKTPDWFAAEAFPVAVFETNSFTALNDQNDFRAEATLTIKGVKVPVTLDFLLHHMHEHEAHIIGQTTLNRNDFGIGWADTKQVADEVNVKIEIKASR